MFDDFDDIPDWEIRDEEPSESLQDKWSKREFHEKKVIRCPECGKFGTEDGLFCIYCGESLKVRAGFLSHLRDFFLNSPVGLTASVFIIIAIACVFIMLF